MTRLECSVARGRPHDSRWRARRPAGPRHARVSSSTPAGRGDSCIARCDLDETPLRWLPPTQGLYTHFEGVERWDRLHASRGAPPYPIDDAALHHVFPGGWIWMLRFNNGITSAGAALTDPVAAAIGAADGARRMDASARHAAVGRTSSSGGARATLPFVHAPRVAFRSARVSGPDWALLPSAAGVIDPLLSTGFPLTLLGILRLLDLLERTTPATRPRSGARRLRAHDAGGAGCDRTAGRRVVRDDGRSAAVQAARPALFRGSELQRSGAPARPAASGARVPAVAHPAFGPELAACASLAAARPDRIAQGGRSSGASTARSSPSTPPVCSIIAPRLVSRACGRPAGICGEVRRDPGRSACAARAHWHARHTTPALIKRPSAVRPHWAEHRRRRSRRERDQPAVPGFVPAN